MENLELKPVIGLEIHVQLKTKSKMFCSCDNDGEDKPANTTVCPICMGHPGTLPSVNRQAVDWGMLVGMALGGKISDTLKFDRKHYFYPDLPKGYQISQFDNPIVGGGLLEIDTDGGPRKISLERAHLEEDAAKSIHSKTGHTLVDYNRSGTPLLEIVTKPDIESPEEAKVFLQELRLICRYLGVSNADMEKGQLRCDANISLRPVEDMEIGGQKFPADKLYPKTEIKNLNSFKAVEKALEHEIKRQACLWSEGNPPAFQSTRGWDEDKGITLEQRGKEEAHDYRYFPEPDLPETEITPEWVGGARAGLTELPRQKRARFVLEYGLELSDARALTESRALANYVERVISELKSWLLSLEETEGTEEEIWEKEGKRAVKLASNWMINRLIPLMVDRSASMEDLRVSAENFAEFVSLIHLRKINSRAAQTVLEKMVETGADPSHVIEEEGLEQVSDQGELEGMVKEAVKNNPKAVEDYRAGKENAVMFLLGQVMKATRGSADPEVAKEMIIKELS